MSEDRGCDTMKYCCLECRVLLISGLAIRCDLAVFHERLLRKDLHRAKHCYPWYKEG